jgi:hypothetical protein
MFQASKEGVPTVILEAIAGHSTRFWHFNFGSPGGLNDVNVLDRLPLFNNAVRGEAPMAFLHYGLWRSTKGFLTLRSVEKHQGLISLSITINTLSGVLVG